MVKQAVRGGLAQGLILNAPSENARPYPPLVIFHNEPDTALTTLRTIMADLA